MYTVVGCNKLDDANNHLGMASSLHLLLNGRGGMPTFPQVLVCLPETNPLTKVYTVVRGRSAVISLLHSSPVHGRCPTALSCLPVEGPPASNHSSTAGWT